MQAYHRDLTYESMQRGGSEEYLCTWNPVETDGSRSDLHQQGSFSCLWEPHVSLLYFARTSDTCRQEVGWRDGGRRIILPMKRRSLLGLLSEFSLTFCECRRSAITEESLSLSFLSGNSFLSACLHNNYEDLSFFLSPSYFFFLS